ncbi:hypothetical protein F4808DRAFT_417123 [Astrocystis sublimbata]|nr:hypothetical protein F4808DRAFT_417123 [Astrocystis sublimbata]
MGVNRCWLMPLNLSLFRFCCGVSSGTITEGPYVAGNRSASDSAGQRKHNPYAQIQVILFPLSPSFVTGGQIPSADIAAWHNMSGSVQMTQKVNINSPYPDQGQSV